jgi:tetratricopeptide (TPR) repeat protein
MSANNKALHEWVDRPEEQPFAEWLEAADKKPRYWPLGGPGGGGKSSLLFKFHEVGKAKNIPVASLDPAYIIDQHGASSRQLLANLVSDNTPEYSKTLDIIREVKEAATLSGLIEQGATSETTWEAAERLIGDKDPDKNLTLRVIKGMAKAGVDLWRGKKAASQKTVITAPEEHLLRALKKDFSQKKCGLLLIDTWEQAAGRVISSRLSFDPRTNEIKTLDKERELQIIDWLEGVARFLFDLPVLLVVAGRTQPPRLIGVPDAMLSAPTETQPLGKQEILALLTKKIPKLPKPSSSVLQDILARTRGNFHMVENVCAYVAEELRLTPSWNWDSWNNLVANYDKNNNVGLLAAILRFLNPDDKDFWHLAIPRRLHKEMGEILFPEAVGHRPAGIAAFYYYVDRGTLKRSRHDHDSFMLHDVTRDAMIIHAHEKNLWLSPEAANIHRQLRDLYDTKSGWPEKFAQFIGPSPLIDQKDLDSAMLDPNLLEAAWHDIHGFEKFEDNFAKLPRGDFAQALEKNFSIYAVDKRRIVSGMNGLSNYQIEKLMEIFNNESKKLNYLDSDAVTAVQRLEAAYNENKDICQSELRKLLNRYSDNAPALFCMAQIGGLTADDRQMLHELAIAADPNHASNLGSFANFLTDIRQNHDRAEELFARAIAADPNHDINLGNFAIFMTDIRHNHERAEELYERAIAADPKHAINLGDFAYFMWQIRHNHERAEELYERAIAADPKNAINLGNFANFMKNIRRNHERAEELYERAIEADPKDADYLGNFAIFMKNIRRNHERAEELFEQAIKADPNNANHLGNFAQMLLAAGRRKEGLAMLERSFAAPDPHPSLQVELWFYVFAHLPARSDQALAALRKLIADGVRSAGWDLTSTIARAKEDGHPDPALLEALAQLISHGGDPAELDKFPAWLGK